MKRIWLAAALLALSGLLTACATTYYTVTTESGQRYTAAGKPELDVKSKTYLFKDVNGHTVILNQGEVTEIKSVAGKN